MLVGGGVSPLSTPMHIGCPKVFVYTFTACLFIHQRVEKHFVKGGKIGDFSRCYVNIFLFTCLFQGPELKRAISGNLDEMLEVSGEKDDDDTTHRRNIPFFGSIGSGNQQQQQTGNGNNLNVSSQLSSRVSPMNLNKFQQRKIDAE